MNQPEPHPIPDGAEPGDETPPPPQIPWENRKQIGRIRAYWQIAWIVMFRPAKLEQFLDAPVCEKHAKHFRRVTFQLTAIITLGVLIAWPFTVFYAGPPPEGTPARSQPFAFIVFLRFVFAVLSLIGLFLATRSLEWFCSPKDFDESRQDRAILLSCYACGPILVVTVIGAIVSIVAIQTWTAYDAWTTVRVLNYAWWAVFLVWWVTSVRAIHFTTGRSRQRTAIAMFALPAIWGVQQLLVAYIPISIAQWFLIVISTT